MQHWETRDAATMRSVHMHRSMPAQKGVRSVGHLPLELAKRLDYWSDSSVNNPIVFNRLPDVLKELGKVFLGDMQHLHDRGPLWVENDCRPVPQRSVELIMLPASKRITTSNNLIERYTELTYNNSTI
jgi:hypothetical protein